STMVREYVDANKAKCSAFSRTRVTISLCASNEAATLTSVGGSTRMPKRSIRRLRRGSSQRNATARKRAAGDDASFEDGNEESARRRRGSGRLRLRGGRCGQREGLEDRCLQRIR